METTGPSLGHVVLEIGGRQGGLVVHLPPEFEGDEIEIRRLCEPWAGRHVAVRARPAIERPVFAAVFGPLEEGQYELRRRDWRREARSHRVEVVGGEVVDTHWPMSDDA